MTATTPPANMSPTRIHARHQSNVPAAKKRGMPRHAAFMITLVASFKPKFTLIDASGRAAIPSGNTDVDGMRVAGTCGFQETSARRAPHRRQHFEQFLKR